MIKIGDKNFYPTWIKIGFFGKKGAGRKPPKISQKLNQLSFGSNFQGKLNPMNDQSWQQKFLPHLYQNPIFGQKGGGETPKISQKLNQIGFGSNFQSKLKPINDQSWLQKILPHLNQNPIFGKK